MFDLKSLMAASILLAATSTANASLIQPKPVISNETSLQETIDLVLAPDYDYFFYSFEQPSYQLLC